MLQALLGFVQLLERAVGGSQVVEVGGIGRVERNRLGNRFGRFRIAAALMRRDSQQLVVTTTQGAVLSLLRGNGPLGVGELARAEGVRPPTMTQIINRMEQLGWVARTGPAVRGSRARASRCTSHPPGLARALRSARSPRRPSGRRTS